MTTNERLRQISTLADCNEYQYLLLGDLRDLLEEFPDDSSRPWLRAVLDAIVQTMPMEREFLEDGGYLSEVIDIAPEWNRRIQLLHIRKLSLDFTIRSLRSRIEAGGDLVSLGDQTAAELRDWMTAFVEHHRMEREVIQEAFLLDIGGGD